MNQKRERHFYTLAALLHDIGKFYQRTGAKIQNKDNEQFTKNNGYWHAAFTAEFIDEYLDQKFIALRTASADHHVAVDGIVKNADFYASGHDRRSEESYQQEETSSNYITDRMYSIFYVLFDIKNNEPSYINLSSQSNYFPSIQKEFANLDINSAKEKSKALYKKLFDEMTTKIKNIKASSYQELHHYLYPIIKEYTTTIPSSTYNVDVPTVSLFDHLKLTAAITNCLNNENLSKEKEFLIVEYDLSGIQSFIYQITEGNNTKPYVARSLRTRSFYLNVLCDFIAYKIAHAFNVTYENILYTSGGRGQVLVPNLINSSQILQDLVDEITKEIFKVHHTQISFSFASAEINSEELMNAKFKELIYGDSRKMLTNKAQKFLPIITKSPELFNHTPLKKSCTLCEKHEAPKGDFCEFCNQLLKLNDVLTDDDKEVVVVEFDYENRANDGIVTFKFGSLGQIIFHHQISEKSFRSNSYYLTINKPIIGEVKYYAKGNTGGKSFEQIASKSQGDPKLAVLKMDVDNLGWIFTKGFKEDTTTISKVLTLSRNMDFFFTKIIRDITNLDKFKGSVYIIYSGGDDLAIVLPASMVLEFVYEVNQRFSEYTNNNSIHLSAGIEVFHPKSPVRFAILRANEELDNAKRREGKNAIGFLDEVIPNSKLKDCLNEVDYFIKALKNKQISRSALYNIYQAIMVSLEHHDSETAYQRYIPNIAYSIARNIENKELFNKLKTDLIRSNITIDDLQFYKIVYAYVLMSTRGGENNE